MPSDKNRGPFLETKLQQNVQNSTFFSTNGCRVDTNKTLSIFFSDFKIFKISLHSSTAILKDLKMVIVCTCVGCKITSYLLGFYIMPTVFGINQSVQKMFIYIWSTYVQYGRSSHFKQSNLFYMYICSANNRFSCYYGFIVVNAFLFTPNSILLDVSLVIYFYSFIQFSTFKSFKTQGNFYIMPVVIFY